MQTKPEQITPTFAPETRFNVNLTLSTRPEPMVRCDSPMRVRLIAAQDNPEWRGVRFSALND